MKKIFSLLSAVLVCMAANAQVNLADVIKSAQANAKVQVAEGNTDYEVAPVTLTESNTYVLDSYVDLGTQNAVIFGGGAKVIVKGEGQIATSSYLKIYGVNFDLSEATVAPIAMSKTPDEALKLKDNYPGANQDMYYDLDVVAIDHCNFSNVKNSVFTANGNNWAMKMVKINSSIIQIADGAGKNVFDFKGSIKNLEVTNNTIYSIAEGGFTKSVWYLGNGSNAQPKKAWGDGATAQFTVTNNTMANLVKNHADQWPSTNAITVTAKRNVFYNVFRFKNKFVGNDTKDYAVNDNIQYSDLASSTVEDGFAVVVDPGFTVPTTALDFANISALKANFTNKASQSLYAAYGDPRWAPVVYKSAITKNVAGKAYECVLGPDMIATQTLTTADGTTADKPVTVMDWIKYVNPTNTFVDGVEVQQSNRWTDINPTTGDVGTWLQAKGANGSVNSPVVSNQWGKFLCLYITNATKIKVYATGSASGAAADGNAVVLRAITSEGDTTIVKSTPGGIYGKGTASDVVETALDASKYYTIEIDGLNKDIQITGVNIWGTNLKPIPEAYHSPILAKGEKYEVTLTADMLCKPVDGVNKWAFDPVYYAWAKYIDLGSDGNGNYVADGIYEATRSGAYSSVDMKTGAKIAADATYPSVASVFTGTQYAWSSYDLNQIATLGDACSWSDVHNWGAPKINADYKSMEFNITGTKAVRFVLSGGSGKENNSCKITVVDEEGNVAAEKISESMANKSNKASAANSTVCTIDGLDVDKKYTIKVTRNENDVFVYAIHLAKDASVFAAADAMGETTAISEVNANNAVKTVKYISNGRIVIKSAKGTFSVAGAQIK